MQKTNMNSRTFILAALLVTMPVIGHAETTPAIETPTLTTSTLRPIDAAQTAALLKANRKKNWNIAQAAVEAGADVNAADKDGASALMLAAAARQTELAQLLLERGANVNALDKKGRSALHYAIPESNKPKKKKFGFGKMLGSIAGGAISGQLGDIAGSPLSSSLLGGTPLDSLMGGNLSSLLSGSAFDLTGKSGWTAILGSALQGDMGGKQGIASLLGGDLSSLGAGGWTSLLSSVKGNKPEIISAMSMLGEGGSNQALWSQFLSNASSGNIGSVEMMMQNPELSGLLSSATSGLTAAASTLPGNASRTIITDLLRHGAQLNTANSEGKTAAHIAKERGLESLVSLLNGQTVTPVTQPETEE